MARFGRLFAAAVALVYSCGTVSATPGQGCYNMTTHTCSNASATCSPRACKASGGGWISASSAQSCTASCTTMAPGVIQGDAITALAKSFGDASSLTAKRTNYVGDGGATTSLQGMAQSTGTSDLGDEIDAFIMAAFDSTGLFASTAAIDYADGKMEAVKKGVMNQLMAHMTIKTMETALNNTDTQMWDKAWGIYGYLGASSASATLYATANKRCKNYDTCESNRPLGNGANDAKANTAVEDAFKTMSQSSVDIIKANIKGTYIQASLRYANKMDNDLTASPLLEHREHQGEGLSFFKVLRPHIVGDSLYSKATILARIDAVYEAKAVPGLDGRYCQLLGLLSREVPSGFVMGVLNEAGTDSCHANNDAGATAGYAITALAKSFSSAAIGSGGTAMDVCAETTAGKKRAVYIGDGGATTSLQGLAKGSGSNGVAIDAFIMSAFDCTGVFADGAAIGFLAGREEAVKKGVMNQLMSHLAITYANEAVCGSTVDAAAWAKAAIVYGEPHDVSVSATPQATANKRCKNYGTCASITASCASAAGTGCIELDYQAKTNVAVFNAFLVATAANKAVIANAIKVTYIQALLRYLNKMDNDFAASPLLEHREHQGEGLSFFKVAEPFLNSGVNGVIESMYTTAYTSSSSAVARYCTGLAAVSSQATATEVGTLNENKVAGTCSATYSGSTSTVSLGCPSSASTTDTVTSKTSSASTAVATMSLLLAMALAVA